MIPKKTIAFFIGLMVVTFLLIFAARSAGASTVCACEQVPTVSIIEVSDAPTQAPTIAEETPTATLEATLTPTDVPQSPHGDGLSDGRESGHANAPSAPPATGKGN
jgi:hypothetical protein